MGVDEQSACHALNGLDHGFGDRVLVVVTSTSKLDLGSALLKVGAERRD
jgi:hypothetical protein